ISKQASGTEREDYKENNSHGPSTKTMSPAIYSITPEAIRENIREEEQPDSTKQSDDNRDRMPIESTLRSRKLNKSKVRRCRGLTREIDSARTSETEMLPFTEPPESEPYISTSLMPTPRAQTPVTPVTACTPNQSTSSLSPVSVRSCHSEETEDMPE